MIDNRTIFTRIQVAKLEMVTDNSGLQIAWNFIRGKITGAKFASVVFQDQKILDRTGIGGFFTTKSFVNILYLSKDYLSDGKIKFKNDDAAAVFLHECCHYLHLVSNQGRYSQKDDEIVTSLPPANPTKVNPKSRYYAEREAWFLSLNMNKVFRLNLLDEINRINTRNMLIVEKSNGQRKITMDEVEKIERTMTIDQFHWKD
jgi:hypothetical protein